jgi:carnosine N-methyltransferase
VLGIADPGAFELTNDELLALVNKFGFTIESAETGIPSPYIQDSTSMLLNTYRASFWVARKR